jgi:hypothetical protein
MITALETLDSRALSIFMIFTRTNSSTESRNSISILKFSKALVVTQEILVEQGDEIISSRKLKPSTKFNNLQM